MRVKQYTSGMTGVVVESDTYHYKVRLDKPQGSLLFAFWPKDHCYEHTGIAPKVMIGVANGPWGPIPRDTSAHRQLARHIRRKEQLARQSIPRSWQYTPKPTKQGQA